jgi:hypothetical protein
MARGITKNKVRRAKTKAWKTVRERFADRLKPATGVETGRTSSAAPASTEGVKSAAWPQEPKHVGSVDLGERTCSIKDDPTPGEFARGVAYARANPPAPKSIAVQLDEARTELAAVRQRYEYAQLQADQAVKASAEAHKKVFASTRKVDYLTDCLKNGER